MMFKTHLAIAILVSLFAAYFFPSLPFFVYPLFLFSALLPDIDTAKSFIGKRLKPLSYALNFVFGHRGFFHSLFAPLILAVLLSFYRPLIAISMFAGYSLHLFCDAMTMEGVRLFYPLLHHNFKGFIKTGGFAEHLIFLFVCCCIGFFSVFLLQ